MGEPLAGDRYEATFDGNGHVIRNLKIRLTGGGRYDHVGMFGGVGVSGKIRSTGLVNVDITVAGNSENTGGLVGTNYGRIASSYVSGSVRAGWHAGGLVGRMRGDGVLIASYADVSVTVGGNAVGGLVGSMHGSSIVSASYSISDALSAPRTSVGGLVGERSSNNTEIQASYFDSDRRMLSSCCGTSPPPSDAVSATQSARTSDDLRGPTTTTDTIYAGWDKLNVDGVASTAMGVVTLNDDAPWDFGNSLQYPVLRWGRTEAAVQAQYSRQPEITLTPVLVGDATVSEDATATYVVSLSAPLPSDMTASWYWSVSGTAVDARDFGDTTRGRVAITPGGSSASFSVAVVADGKAEPAEVFHVSLRDALLAGGSANMILDGPATRVQTTIAANGVRRVTVASPAMTVDEGATATFTVSLGGSVGEAVVVEYEIVAVSGLTPADLRNVTVMDRAGTGGMEVVALPVTGSVTLDADGAATMAVSVVDDDVPAESGEGFRLRLTRCANCLEHVAEIGVPSSFTVVINDDDRMDYSGDGRLIDVRTPQQLHAIRWDLNGDGVADEQAYATSYSAAFPAPVLNMGCATTCAGYALARDVDLGTSPFGRSSSSAGWLPIGAGNAGYDADFDGRDYVVSGLYINRPTLDHVGLFARLGAGATTGRRIGNLGLINVDVTGNDYVGALAGRVSTDVVVSKVYVSSGSVVGNEGVGGLAGLIGGDVLAVYASVAVSGTSAVGGLAGISSGADARRLVAGYAAGRVVGGGDAGGLIGRVAGITGTVTGVYWDTFVSGLEASALSGLGVGTDTGSLQRPTTYGGIYAALGTWTWTATAPATTRGGSARLLIIRC